MGVAYRGEYGCDRKGQARSRLKESVWVMTCLVVVLNDSKRTFRFTMTISALERKKLSNLNICPFYAGYKTYQCVPNNRIEICRFPVKTQGFSYLLFL